MGGMWRQHFPGKAHVSEIGQKKKCVWVCVCMHACVRVCVCVCAVLSGVTSACLGCSLWHICKLVCVCANTHSALCAWLLIIRVCVCVCSAAKSLANRSGGVEREEKVTQHRYTLIRHSHMHLVYFRSWAAIQWSDCFNCFSCKCLFGLEQKSVFCVLSER